MGKASRWIRNLLLGKKEDKIKKDGGGSGGDGVIIPPSPPSTTAIIPASPRRRWSFRRSNSTQKLAINHKSCRSFDSIMTSQLLSQALFDYAIQHQNHNVKMVVSPKTRVACRVSSAVAATAATKIQAAFRAYLARKALCALRGLVKLQALVRGHLVRKRTTTMVRCMSALVAIQVRARFQRIQTAENTSKQRFMTHHERRLSAPQLDYNDKSGQLGSKPNRQASRRYSTDSSPLTHAKSMRVHSKPTIELDTSSQTSAQHDEPNYMTKTESSRAKTRSQSAPRHRPTTQKRENRRTASNEDVTALTRNHQKGHEGLLTKRYGSSKSTNGFDFDSASTCTNGSCYYTALYDQYEHMIPET
ncbi:hypothetical protein QVD17_09339 [Tagetes erecta]|uniref:DUF4005 domain-containing protein n=1 Tax=Tagetes erecta TaxID=13708 RepID=A0AAD8L3P6_TARER|nr:hypothetical protein QVD17_09339 [Tagetes erecta]